MMLNISDKSNKCLKKLRSKYLVRCHGGPNRSWTQVRNIVTKNQMQRLTHALFILSIFLQLSHGFLVEEPTIVGLENGANPDNASYNTSNRGYIKSVGNGSTNNLVTSVAANGYLDKLDNLERSVAAVLIKVAYGTTSTTKRSIPDNSYIPSLTTIATPLLTTLRYNDKVPQQHPQINLHHRNYELDLERDHALPTSAPNADILKSNSNPTYPNPNRHNGHERDRHRHLYNSTPMPSLPNLLKKANSQPPTIPMYPGDIPSYSPPSRSFFTPPLPPEYQNPFADKPTLRGTNNEGSVSNSGAYVNRRPIPPPSLMPGHERIPFRPPDLAASTGNNVENASTIDLKKSTTTAIAIIEAQDRKKALNTPSRINDADEAKNKYDYGGNSNHDLPTGNGESTNKGQEVLPSIRRILSGSNGKKGDIPEVLLKQVTPRPISYQKPPSSPVVVIDGTAQRNEYNDEILASSPNINKNKEPFNDLGNDDINSQVKSKSSQKPLEKSDVLKENQHSISSTPSAAAAIGEATATSTSSQATLNSASSKNTASSTVTSSSAAAAATQSTWAIAWNIHVYLSVILFTILAVYSFYKMLTYNKLTHLFSQSYFVCIHLIIFIICATRIFYLCYDAYNIHGSFHIFVAELLLNLPSTFLTVSFSVLILFLFLKSLNHKNNRYSALIRPLTVVVGCGVHVVLCITLHYVESYTLQNQHLYYQQHQQQQYYRRQQQQQSALPSSNLQVTLSPSASLTSPSPPPRVLTLICQIIFIFICLSLGLLYLYLYRILKRILRSKSQNYIHGYQNLSYAIHITIATALLFILLAALQIFGAICISTSRPLITQGTAEIDWLQWGYQFSLRLIEIAIITLISWVAGLKTGGGGNSGVNGDVRSGAGNIGNSIFGAAPSGTMNSREKHLGGHHQHANVANFFLPCTSSSSQEQFDTDYPAICNANTNLHTYTMRTGKLIYDDSYALNALGPGTQNTGQPVGRNSSEYQLQQPTYQRPYDTGSMHSAVNRNVTEYGTQGPHPNPRYHHPTHDQNQYTDYLTDATTDHYENPNFDLRCSSPTVESGTAIQKFTKTSNSSTTALSSGGSGSSGASQQQMLLLQSDSCYSEPLQENSSYEFNNFERPIYGDNDVAKRVKLSGGQECWVEKRIPTKSRDKKPHINPERSGYDNPERCSSNSTNSCASSSGGGGGGGSGNRYTSYNTFDRAYYNNGVRKSGTLNNIVNNNINNPNNGSRGVISNNIIAAANNSQRPLGVQTLALADRQHCHQRSGRINGHGSTKPQDLIFLRSTSTSSKNRPVHQQLQMANYNQSDEDEDDDMVSGSNVECTNLIHSKDGSCITNSSINTGSAAGGSNIAESGNSSDRFPPTAANISNKVPQTQNQHQLHNSNIKHSQSPHVPHVQSNPIAAVHQQHNMQQNCTVEQEAVTSPAPSSNSTGTSSTVSESMLVTEQGFLRFRALDDINNAQGVGIHNASIRNQARGAIAMGGGSVGGGASCGNDISC